MDFMLFGGVRAAARCSCMLLGGARAVGRGRRWNGAKSCHSRCLFLKLKTRNLDYSKYIRFEIPEANP